MPHDRDQQTAAGRTRWDGVPAEERSRLTRIAYLAGAVRSVARYRDQLTDEQKDTLFVALYGPDAA
jgi:hypothetical protein